jgi:soluble lytic murein transglycosylase
MVRHTRPLGRPPQALALIAQLHKPSYWLAVALSLVTLQVAPPAIAQTALTQTPAEIEHFRRFDAAIAPVKSVDISADEAAQLRQTMKAISDQDIFKALELRGGLKDPLAIKLVNWYRLRGGYGQLAEYRPFLAENPAWPERGTLTQRFEELIFTEGGSASTIKEQFKDGEPKSAMGWAALASAELASADTASATAHAGKVWRTMNVPPLLETGFLDRFGKLLSPADHKWRLDRLLMEDVRWATDRTERLATIRRQIQRMSEPEKAKGEARLAVFLKSPEARAKMAAIPADSARGDLGFLYHKIQLLRRSNTAPTMADAQRLALTAPIDPALSPNLDDWWAERRMTAYAALNSGNPKLAYDLVRAAGPLSVNPAKEQSFMAGWLALRFLNNPKAATIHFEAAAKVADGPLSRSKAGYWLGRIQEGEKNTAKAREYYTQAAREIDTFYGQLAQLKLDPKNRRITIKMPTPPSSEQAKRFNELDAVKAVVLAKKAGLDANVTRAFLINLKNHLEGEVDGALVNHLADSLGDTQLALRNAKSGVARGQNLLVYAYPVRTFPSFKPLAKPPEPAFLLGIARQESEFNKNTVSGAGAKGLLQVMNVTAEHVCKDYKIKCELDRLLPDMSYNAQIASAYLGARMGEFGGSYVLTLPGYNAGPGRTREWMRAFGDPRDPKMDPIDWIERIPFQETREYVAKVLSNIQIYRARLGDEAGALQLDLDLVRGRGTALSPALPDAPAAGAAPSNG